MVTVRNGERYGTEICHVPSERYGSTGDHARPGPGAAMAPPPLADARPAARLWPMLGLRPGSGRC
jgi:hypothetical protein